MSILYKNVALLLPDSQGYIVKKHMYLGVKNRHISYIGTDFPEETYQRCLDYSNRLIMPSFVNGHTHSPMTLLRSLGNGLPLHRWLREAIWPVEEKLTAELVSIGARLAIAEMIAAGTTAYSDMYFLSDAIAREAGAAGVKANISWPVIGFDKEQQLVDNDDFNAFSALHSAYHNSYDNRIKIDFSLHAEYTITERLARQYAEHLSNIGGHLHIHLSETEQETQDCLSRHGKSPTAFFLDCGLLDRTSQAAHCVTLTPEDMAILAEKSVTVVHNPTSNMILGSGFAPIAAMMDAGIRLSIGTDGTASNNNLNMFEEMHLAYLIHKGYHRHPELLTPSDMIQMATVNGAAMQGRPDTGLLKTGMKADLIALDLDRPHLMPATDLLSLLVTSAQSSDIVMTMCDGQVLYENGVYTTIDEEKLRSDVNRATASLF